MEATSLAKLEQARHRGETMGNICPECGRWNKIMWDAELQADVCCYCGTVSTAEQRLSTGDIDIVLKKKSSNDEIKNIGRGQL